jgi:hypothetical protein
LETERRKAAKADVGRKERRSLETERARVALAGLVEATQPLLEEAMEASRRSRKAAQKAAKRAQIGAKKAGKKASKTASRTARSAADTLDELAAADDDDE